MQKGMKRRLTSYIALIIILFLGHYLLRDIVWNADIYFHTIVEIISSFLALFVGVLALVHYYNKKSNVSLIIGSGFIGTGLLEAYHAIASLPLFIHLFPSQPAALINWSCVSPRLFLSLALCTNLIAEISEKKLGESGKINKNIIYAIALIFIILNFELTTLLKLPTGFYSGIIWAKPEEIIPGILFLLAFLGYLQKGDWQKGGFYHWLMLFLTVSFMVQFTYMAFSSQPFDIMFNIGHILKIISYLLIITGLFINVYWLFKQEKYQEEYISAILSSIVDCVITTNAKGVIETANPVVTDLFGYSTSELTGRTIDILIPKLVLGEKNMCFIKEDNVFVLPKIIDGNFELIGVRKEGGFFPLTLGINEIKFGNKSIFTLVIRDITQRKEVERIKDDFVSMVNHELRTPLTSIRGSLGLILSNAIGEVSSQIKEMIEVAYSNSNRLLTLINDILDNEKIAAGKMEFKLEPVELMSIIEQTIESVKPYAQQYKVEIKIKEELPGVMVFVDKLRLMQVITNLLANSIKFSHTDSTIEVSVINYNKLIRVSITDYGTGISDEFKTKIFEKFAQGDFSDSRKNSGTGLGLSISKAIIENLGGHIGFNTKVNRGSTFYFELPEWQDQNVYSITEVKDVKNKKVLMLTNNTDITPFIEDIVKQNGFSIDIVSSIKQVYQDIYDLKILDMDLLLQEKFDLKNLKNKSNSQSIPIFLISSPVNGIDKQLTGCLILTDWIDRLINPEHLMAIIQIASANVSVGKLNILYFDTNPEISQILSVILQDVANIYPASNINDVQKLLELESLDLAIINADIFEFNNMDLSALILARKEKNISVVILSMNGPGADSVEVIYGFLQKPEYMLLEKGNTCLNFH